METERPRVLVVDDEEGMREGMSRVLSRRDAIVRSAAGGREALDCLAAGSYDVVLVDLKMPEIDGFQVLARLNETAADRTVTVVVSALATVEAAVEVTRKGAFDFLVKPFTPDDLLEVYDRAVRQRRLLREREVYLSALATERNTSRQILNSFREGLVVVNVDTHPVLMNPRAEYLLGVTFHPGIALDVVLPEEARRIVREILATPNPGADTRVVTVPRGDVLLELTASVASWNQGTTGAIVVIRDITAEWKMEQDKNRFVSMVAHELKSPLAAIINYLNVIQSGMLDKDLAKVHEILDRCKTRGEALLELVRDLLHLNRRDAGKVEKTVETLDLPAAIRDQMEFLQGQADRHGITFHLETAGEDPVLVRMDRGDLDRVFMNLLSNGIKYNRHNGRLDVRVRREGAQVSASVTDTGIGMRAEEMAGLFQEFYRVRNRATKDIAGTGLGLATVRRVLEEYNGKIEVASTPEVGSTFTVRLPAAGTTD